jgi:hypothetical protein
MSCNLYMTENVYLNVQTLDIQGCGNQYLFSRARIQILIALRVPGSPCVIRFHYFVVYKSHRRVTVRLHSQHFWRRPCLQYLRLKRVGVEFYPPRAHHGLWIVDGSEGCVIHVRDGVAVTLRSVEPFVGFSRPSIGRFCQLLLPNGSVLLPRVKVVYAICLGNSSVAKMRTT